MTTAMMNAAEVRTSSGIAAPHLTRRPVPRPRADEVLLRVHAVLVQPDAVPGPFSQTVPDAAGQVLMAGPRVTGWPGGARVLAYGNTESEVPAAYREFCTVPVSSLQMIPPGVSFVAAAGMGTPYSEAWAALFADGRLRKDDRVVVVGAAEPQGVAALQICRWQGIRVVAVSDGRDARRLTALGAGRVVSHSAGDLAGRIRKALGERGATLVVNVSGTVMQASLDCLEEDGRIILTGGNGPQQIDVRRLLERRAHIVGSTERADPADRTQILRLVAGGNLLPVIDSIYPFSQIGTAQQKASTRPLGSVLLVPDGLFS